MDLSESDDEGKEPNIQFCVVFDGPDPTNAAAALAAAVAAPAVATRGAGGSWVVSCAPADVAARLWALETPFRRVHVSLRAPHA